jgi:hypothetical protein
MPTTSADDPVGKEESVGPYEQIILYGDSITQQSFHQDDGFGFGAALQNCKLFAASL